MRAATKVIISLTCTFIVHLSSYQQVFAKESLSGLKDYPFQPVTEGNWMQEGNLRWMARNFSVKPTLLLSRGNQIFDIPRKATSDIEQRTFSLPGDLGQISILEALEAADTDAYMVIRDGTIIYERYFHDFSEYSHHSWFSSAKSLIGMAMGILVTEHKIDVGKTPADYLPPLKGSAFDKATIRQTLNMTTALGYTFEDSALQTGHFRHEYYARAGMLPAFEIFTKTLNPKTASVPRGIRGMTPLLQTAPQFVPGETFSYQNINVDIAGWLIEEISGMPLHHFLRDRIWAKLQTEHDALIPVDPNYTALASGGFSSTLRDAARFALAVLYEGKLGDETIFPTSWIRETYNYSEAEAKAFANHSKQPGPDFSALGAIKAYKNYWYIFDRNQGAMATRGFAGQSIYINKEKSVAILTFASAPQDKRDNSSRLMYLTHLLANDL